MRVSLDALSLTMPGGRAALSGVDLAAERGERVAVIGPSGAGKTSLLRACGCALRPTQGNVRLDGADPWGLAREGLRRLRCRIGAIHQAPPLPPRQRVVTAVLAGRLGAWGLWRGIGSLIYPRDMIGAREALGRVELSDRLFDRCDRLSGGQLQRVEVARVLYQRPDLVLADEPVSALDPQLADHTVRELNSDARERGATLIASLHAVDLALKWFPRIVGLRDGQIVFDRPPAGVTDAMLRELYGTESPGVPTQSYLPVELAEPKPRAAAGGQPLCR